MRLQVDQALRNSDFNVEILKNKLESAYTEQQLIEQKTAKQQEQIHSYQTAISQLRRDIQYLKKQSKFAGVSRDTPSKQTPSKLMQMTPSKQLDVSQRMSISSCASFLPVILVDNQTQTQQDDISSLQASLD